MSTTAESDSRVFRLGRALVSSLLSTFHALNDADALHISNSPYSTIRMTRPWVYYQGTKTTVPISILGRTSLPEDYKITLQRRGWRTGLFGWTFGAWLGGTVGKEVDVTPQNTATSSWETNVAAKKRKRYDDDASQFQKNGVIPSDHRMLATAFVHIPVAAGDGYFRLLVKDQKKTIAATPVFRVGSLSLSSANPRGASPLTVVPELVFKSASVTATTAAYAAFFAAFPFLKAASFIPGTSTWAYVGVDEKLEELRERYRVDERRAQASETMYKTVPFGSMGVRTLYDLEEDARLGKGGVVYKRS
ncbi:hypothetical protein MKEN_01003900 [Mycena kentingensis (nom. inval.)]|nr:hypothetical protein MKEN_01003900 [Mycena kentingensis (nom. inval.)]